MTLRDNELWLESSRSTLTIGDRGGAASSGLGHRAAGTRMHPRWPPASRMGMDPVKSILVVDDDSMVARLLEEILRSEGHRVTTALNGVEALAVLADQAFDLLLVDIRIPELDGPALYRELERRSLAPARRVMFMTGGAVGPETAEFLSTVRTPLLRKPFEVEAFRATVHRFFLATDLREAAERHQPPMERTRLGLAPHFPHGEARP